MSNLFCRFEDDKIYAEIENTKPFKQNFDFECVYEMEVGNPKVLKGKNVGVEGNTKQYAGGDSTTRKPTGVKSKKLDVA